MENVSHDSGKESLNKLEEEQAAYSNLEKRRRKESILLSDTEKFYLFTRLMRIDKMLKTATVSNKRQSQ